MATDNENMPELEEQVRKLMERMEELEISEKRRIYQSRLKAGEQMRKLPCHFPLGILYYNTNLQITHCNEQILSQTKLSREQFLHLDLTKLKDSSILPALRKALEGEEGSYEGYYQGTFYNKRVYISLRTAPIYDSSGQVTGGMGLLEDITDWKMAEGALRENMVTARAFLDSTPDDAFIVNRKGYITAVNQPGAENIGRPADELIGQNIYDLISPLRSGEWKKCVEEVITSKKIVHFEEQHEERYFETIIYPFFNARGGVERIGIYTRDITEQKRSAGDLLRALKKMRELEAIINRSPVIVFLWRLADDWPVEYVSDNVKQIGYTADDLMSGRVSWQDIIHPDDVQKVIRELARHALEGIPEFQMDFRLLAKSGEVRWVSNQTKAISDDRGMLTHYQGILVDITEQKRIYEALLESESRYRAVVEQQMELICRITPQAVLTFVNDACCRFFGKTHEELLGHNFMEFIYAEDRLSVEKQLASLTRDHDSSSHETRVITPDGEQRWLRWNSLGLFDNEGRLLEIQSVGRDITDRKQAEAEIKALSLEDDLTGVYNRRGFMALARQQLMLAHRVERDMILIFIDLDNLKEINDTFGHPEGDRALKDFAFILKNTFRESDIIGRIGGDEFVVLALEVETDGTDVIILRLKDALHIHKSETTQPYHLSASIGCARYNPKYPETLDELLSMADQRMYKDKKNKRRKD